MSAAPIILMFLAISAALRLIPTAETRQKMRMVEDAERAAEDQARAPSDTGRK